MCGIAVARFGITPTQFYWEFTPLELHQAFKARDEDQRVVLRLICETIRNVAVTVFNNALGRKNKDKIKDPQKLWKFGWEEQTRPKIQTVDEMKSIMLGLSWQHGESKPKKEDS